MAKDEAAWISDLADEHGRRQRIEFLENYEFLAAKLESPIERVLLAGLLLADPEGIGFFGFSGNLQPFSSLMHLPDHDGVEYVGAIYPQVTIGRYRVDFYFEAYDKQSEKCWFRAAVECDGHDFHERTKEQAIRDKRRDRWFQTRGISVLRFTGSEIWADPEGCADQVYDAFHAAWQRVYRGRSE